jgi:hypothetical protein
MYRPRITNVVGIRVKLRTMERAFFRLPVQQLTAHRRADDMCPSPSLMAPSASISHRVLADALVHSSQMPFNSTYSY